MSNQRQSGAWVFFILLAIALLCAVTSHRRLLPFPEPDENFDESRAPSHAYTHDSYDDGEPYVPATKDDAKIHKADKPVKVNKPDENDKVSKTDKTGSGGRADEEKKKDDNEGQDEYNSDEEESLLISASTNFGTSISRIRAAMMKAHVQILED